MVAHPRLHSTKLKLVNGAVLLLMVLPPLTKALTVSLPPMFVNVKAKAIVAFMVVMTIRIIQVPSVTCRYVMLVMLLQLTMN